MRLLISKGEFNHFSFRLPETKSTPCTLAPMTPNSSRRPSRSRRVSWTLTSSTSPTVAASKSRRSWRLSASWQTGTRSSSSTLKRPGTPQRPRRNTESRPPRPRPLPLRSRGWACAPCLLLPPRQRDSLFRFDILIVFPVRFELPAHAETFWESSVASEAIAISRANILSRRRRSRWATTRASSPAPARIRTGSTSGPLPLQRQRDTSGECK